MADEGKSMMAKAVAGAIAVASVVRGVRAARSSGGPDAERTERDAAREARMQVGGRERGTGDGGGRDRGNDGTGVAAESGHDRDGEQPSSGDAGGPKRIVKKLDRYQRRHAWLGFPLGVVKKFGEDQAANLAALISYYTFFSLFPLLLALVTILGFVLAGRPDLQDRVVDSALAQFPVIGGQIRNNIGSLTGNWAALAVGLGGALWAGMGAVDATQNAMNSIWDVPLREKPKFITRRLRSLLMLVVLGGGFFLTAVASTLAASVAPIGPVGRLVTPFAALAINTGVFLVAFRVLTERDLRWSDVLPGAVVAGLAAVLFQVVGGFYVTRSLQGATQTYGTFAVVIGLLSWLYLQAQVTLYAAEINVVRSRRLWPRGLDSNDLTDADRRALAQHAEVEERVPRQDVQTAIPAGNDERGADRETAGAGAR